MSNPLEVDRNPIYFLCVDEGQYRQQTNLSCRLLSKEDRWCMQGTAKAQVYCLGAVIHRFNMDYRTLNLKILQAIWLWWQSECSRLYSLIECRKFEKIDMIPLCLFCRLTNLFRSSVLCCLARLLCSISLFMKLNRPTICSFRCFKKLIMYNAWF